jgi:hypothetical protein
LLRLFVLATVSMTVNMSKFSSFAKQDKWPSQNVATCAKLCS